MKPSQPRGNYEASEINNVCVSETCRAHNNGRELCDVRRKKRVLGHFELRAEGRELWYVPAE